MSEGNRNELTSTSAEERTKAKPRSDEASTGLSEESLARVTGGMAIPPILTPIKGPEIEGEPTSVDILKKF